MLSHKSSSCWPPTVVLIPANPSHPPPIAFKVSARAIMGVVKHRVFTHHHLFPGGRTFHPQTVRSTRCDKGIVARRVMAANRKQEALDITHFGGYPWVGEIVFNKRNDKSSAQSGLRITTVFQRATALRCLLLIALLMIRPIMERSLNQHGGERDVAPDRGPLTVARKLRRPLLLILCWGTPCDLMRHCARLIA